MGKNKVKITIAIPAYNAEKTIAEAIKSAQAQDYPLKEIIVYDDGSTDRTREIVQAHNVGILTCTENKGIGRALESLMSMSQTKYIVYLCADDVFTNSQVVSDIVSVFDKNPLVGVVTRYYYQYMNGHAGAISVCRDHNVLTNTCNPSGVAFRVDKDAKSTNDIFVEMPTMVKWYLEKDYHWAMMKYDTVAARIHPGGNTGTKKKYYTQSPIRNWTNLVGKQFRYHPGFVQLRARVGIVAAWKEICEQVKIDKRVLFEASFWFFALSALIIPGFIIRPLYDFYRHRIARHLYTIIERK